MSSDLPSSFDFNARAKALLKQLSPASGPKPNATLAAAAIEVALREAFAAGQGARRQVPVKKAGPAAPAPGPRECDHEWKEVFLDGRDLGKRCIHCDILERDIQDQCSHYFVDVKGTEICMACRKVRKSSKAR